MLRTTKPLPNTPEFYEDADSGERYAPQRCKVSIGSSIYEEIQEGNSYARISSDYRYVEANARPTDSINTSEYIFSNPMQTVKDDETVAYTTMDQHLTRYLDVIDGQQVVNKINDFN